MGTDFIEHTEQADALINSGDIEELRDYLGDVILTNIVHDDRFDLIEKIYAYFKGSESIEQEIFLAVIENGKYPINSSSIKSLKLLESIGGDEVYLIDDEDDVYYMCQISSNVKLLEGIFNLKTNISWGFALEVSCNFLNLNAIDFILENVRLTIDDINTSFAALINSTETFAHAKNTSQREMISKFINEMNADVNLKTDYGRERAFFDCFSNAPDAAKFFYTKNFDSDFINSKSFWKEFIEDLKIERDDYRLIYKKAFDDLKFSGIDLTELIKLFNELGYQNFANELLID